MDTVGLRRQIENVVIKCLETFFTFFSSTHCTWQFGEVSQEYEVRVPTVPTGWIHLMNSSSNKLLNCVFVICHLSLIWLFFPKLSSSSISLYSSGQTWFVFSSPDVTKCHQSTRNLLWSKMVASNRVVDQSYCDAFYFSLLFWKRKYCKDKLFFFFFFLHHHQLWAVFWVHAKKIVNSSESVVFLSLFPNI